jgi:predicted alpha/beta-hydrolase family hydrolase
MNSQPVTIALERAGTVSGALYVPEKFERGRTPAVIVAHGAGNDMKTPLLVHFCDGLCRAGYPCLRFNFRYMELGRRAPDPQQALVRSWRAVFRFVQSHPRIGGSPIVIGGKSMGGRIASHAAAEGLLSPAGLVFLGYPLHPAGKPERLRDAHLFDIAAPMLFFAGTRDALCDLGLLKGVIERLGAPAALEIIDGGDHSFSLPKSAASPVEAVYDRIVARTIAWMTRALARRE